MKVTIYELVGKRKELIQELENLRNERKEKASEMVKIDKKDEVGKISLSQYSEQIEKLMDKVVAITVLLRKKNVEQTIDKTGMTPEEAKVKRELVDEELAGLRGLGGSERDLFSDRGEIVKISRIDREELNSLIKKLSEERRKLDSALQKFNLTNEVEIEI